MKNAMLTFGETKAVDKANRRLDIIANSFQKDRDGDLFLPGAFDKSLPPYLAKNPVVMGVHDWHAQLSVVGKALSGKSTKDGLFAQIEFATIEANPLAENYWLLYRDGFMNTFSVGFIPTKIVYGDAIDADIEVIAAQLARYGMTINDVNLKGVNRVFVEAELLEISCVPIPSERGAVVVRGFDGECLDKAGHMTTKGFESLVKSLVVDDKTEGVDKPADAVVIPPAEAAPVPVKLSISGDDVERIADAVSLKIMKKFAESGIVRSAATQDATQTFDALKKMVGDFSAMGNSIKPSDETKPEDKS